MGKRFACRQCPFSIILDDGGRFLRCPRCHGEVDCTEVPVRTMRHKRPPSDRSSDKKASKPER